MKVVFAGPTIYGLALPNRAVADLVFRPPAQQGDIARAVVEGAAAVGLVDGRYEDVAAPWHKEILFALDRGVRVYGAASMGALRAAECAAFGMVPIGEVAARYLSGEITDDAAVAQIHGPAELDFVPLSEALVNVEATIAAARNAGALAPATAAALVESARRLFFKDRTMPAVVADAGFDGERGAALLRILDTWRRDVKREDAAALIATMRAAPAARATDRQTWRFREPSAWRRFMTALHAEYGILLP